MWHWDQGHIPFFQFDALRKSSVFALSHDFRAATREELLALTGLDFKGPKSHSPWRQYARVLKRALLVSELGSKAAKVAAPTPIAAQLADAGAVTCDEYFHFFARAFTEPSPAAEGWQPEAEFRYPLLFSLKYLLAKRSIAHSPVSTIYEVIGAYRKSGFIGDEGIDKFISIVGTPQKYEAAGESAPGNLKRQARESLIIICQISYLHLNGAELTVSLDALDAKSLFAHLHPIGGKRATEPEAEIRRISGFFKPGATQDWYEYPNTIVNDVVLSGFSEGNRVERTHLVIERNRDLQKAFFLANPSPVCDVCLLDTAQTYPWAKRVLDLHHLLPLSSGTRVELAGKKFKTTIKDLVPICPTCHRAVHKYYDHWLKVEGLRDFPDENHAKQTYQTMKEGFGGAIHG